MTAQRTQLRREVARALLAAWRSCCDAEEDALRAAARDHMLSPAVVHEHLDLLVGERRRIGAAPRRGPAASVEARSRSAHRPGCRCGGGGRS